MSSSFSGSATMTSTSTMPSPPPPPSNTPGSDGGGGGGSGFRDSGLFGANGSPPLILAFLAIGLFGIAMIVVFGFRRMHAGRWDNLGRPGFGGRGLRGVPELGEKPKLWDLWTKGPCMMQGSSGPHSNLWEGVQPFSVTVVDEKGESVSHGEKGSSGDPTSSLGDNRPRISGASGLPIMTRARRRLNRLLGRPIPPSPSSPSPSSTGPGHTGSAGAANSSAPAAVVSDGSILPIAMTSISQSAQTGNPGKRSSEHTPEASSLSASGEQRLQIAVAILMPTPRQINFQGEDDNRPSDGGGSGETGSTPAGGGANVKTVTTGDEEDEDVLEYSIGVLSVPWQSAELDEG